MPHPYNGKSGVADESTQRFHEVTEMVEIPRYGYQLVQAPYGLFLTIPQPENAKRYRAKESDNYGNILDNSLEYTELFTNVQWIADLAEGRLELLRQMGRGFIMLQERKVWLENTLRRETGEIRAWLQQLMRQLDGELRLAAKSRADFVMESKTPSGRNRLAENVRRLSEERRRQQLLASITPYFKLNLTK